MTQQPWPEQTPVGRCARCSGWLQYTEDLYGPYIHCLNCGHHTDVDEHETVAHPEGAEDPQPHRRWYPARDETQERYRTLRDIILRQKLSPAQAEERLGLSRRTYYRVLDGAPRPV